MAAAEGVTVHYSPRKWPIGFRSSTWSQTTLIAIIIGTASSIPQTPHTQLQNNRPANTAIRFICAAHPGRRQDRAFERGNQQGGAGHGRRAAERAELQEPHHGQPAGHEDRAVVGNRIEDAGEQPPERGLVQAERPQRPQVTTATRALVTT